MAVWTRVARRRRIPNTLVHVAIHSAVFGPLRAPFAAVFAGCVTPDLPWIVRRLIDMTSISLEPISALAYFIAQASLVGCVFPCIAFGFLFTNFKPVAALALLGCLVHLLLDSLQVKWGNGVHLFAPYDWEILSLSVFQIDSVFTNLLTFAGIIPFLFVTKARHDARLLCLNPVRLAGCCICLIAYFAVPFLFISDVVASNSRYLQTLENKDERRGKMLELDRETASVTGDTWYTTTHIGEVLAIVNPDANMTDGGTYSFRAEFYDEREIWLIDWKRHSGMRDIASYIGLLAIACWMTTILILSRRLKSVATEDAT